jgi:hypothetical protein
VEGGIEEDENTLCYEGDAQGEDLEQEKRE